MPSLYMILTRCILAYITISICKWLHICLCHCISVRFTIQRASSTSRKMVTVKKTRWASRCNLISRPNHGRGTIIVHWMVNIMGCIYTLNNHIWLVYSFLDAWRCIIFFKHQTWSYVCNIKYDIFMDISILLHYDYFGLVMIPSKYTHFFILYLMSGRDLISCLMIRSQLWQKKKKLLLFMTCEYM